MAGKTQQTKLESTMKGEANSAESAGGTQIVNADSGVQVEKVRLLSLRYRI